VSERVTQVLDVVILRGGDDALHDLGVSRDARGGDCQKPSLLGTALADQEEAGGSGEDQEDGQKY
jgi:hypothetical protein